VADARAEVLGRLRAALGPSPGAVDVPRRYRGSGRVGPAGAPDVVDRFCARVEEYSATVRRVDRADLPAAIAAVCRERGTARLAVAPGGLGADGVIEGVELVEDDPPLAPRVLDEIDGVLTGCALAIAETGTIALDGGPRSGRRALTLVPDHHVCLVEAGDVLAGVPDAVERLAEAARAGRPITLVSGPSATSDIELDRVEGVHGPRKLDVLVVA
jgi:L-lactate dehydrogenase complex protein LldG